jgi:hypothetical protein
MKKTRKHSTILLALLSAVLVFSLAAPPCAEAYGRGIHQDIDMYAKMLANQNLSPYGTLTVPDWMQDINQYVPDINTADPDLYDITAGASNEDEVDHVWNHEGWCVTITHFWDPDQGDDATMNTAVCGLTDPNAWQKARILWGMALGQYYNGNKHAAYEYLGHITHLLADVTVPTHAHFDSHIYPDSYDDQYINGDGFDYLPEYLTDTEKVLLQLKGMVNIPNPTVIPSATDPANGTALFPLYWLFYTNAQVGGYYPSDDYDGNADDPWRQIDPNSPFNANLVDFSELPPIPEGFTHSDLDGCDYTNPSTQCAATLAAIRAGSYMRAIRSVAALYKLWAETVNKQAELTVVLDQVRTVEKADPDDVQPPTDPFDNPDYFVRVWIGTSAPDHSLDTNGGDDGVYSNGVWFRNEGEQTYATSADDGWIDLPLINGGSGWAFASDVGMNGTAHVEIEMYDDDSLPGLWRGFAYEHWDIYTENPDNEERNIWLDVNLDACRARTPGAIGGDLSMTCGAEGSSAGDDTPIADIKFRILPPNTPPTAHAGDDQTKNEGDTVTLNGTFEDPDPDDSWTYLWHMENSTNSQVIPDSKGPAYLNSPVPLTFVPCDNGVYTFSFTVTDNHGASGSDTVVVTVLNVPPVVITAPYISHQENAEFILPVVHETDFTGTFTDAGKCDTHTALWNWGDSSISKGVINELSGSGSVTGSHVFSQPGDYTVNLTVTDDDGDYDGKTMTVHVAGVKEALNIFNTYIQTLPNSKFKNSANQRKTAYNSIFLSLNNMLAKKDYKGMIRSLNNNIRTTFDGQVGGSVKDDWIKEDLATQTELCQKVDDITEYLQYLLSTMP